MITIKTLTGISIEQIHKAFSKAFADYVEPMELTVKELQHGIERRGYNPDLSFGAFNGNDSRDARQFTFPQFFNSRDFFALDAYTVNSSPYFSARYLSNLGIMKNIKIKNIANGIIKKENFHVINAKPVKRTTSPK